MTEDSSLSHSDTGSSSSEAEGNPNLRLVSVLLNEFNFVSWSRAISLALGGRAKLGFVNGSAVQPEPLADGYETWLVKDHLVMSWLLNSMEPEIADIFNFSLSAADLWKSVEEMYGNQNNAARVFQIKGTSPTFNKKKTPLFSILGS